MPRVSFIDDLMDKIIEAEIKEEIPESIDSKTFNLLVVARKASSDVQKILYSLKYFFETNPSEVRELVVRQDIKIKKLEQNNKDLNNSFNSLEYKSKYENSIKEIERLNKENFVLKNKLNIKPESVIVYKDRIINRITDDIALELLAEMEIDYKKRLQIETSKMFNVETKLMSVEQHVYNLLRDRQGNYLEKIMILVKECLRILE